MKTLPPDQKSMMEQYAESLSPEQKQGLEDLVKDLPPDMKIPGLDDFKSAVAVRDHAEANLLEPIARLDAALSHATAQGLPPINVNALSGKFLALQCQVIGAKSVLEIGSLAGFSSIHFAQSGAKVTSVEIDPKHAETSRHNTKGLDVEVILGAALEVLPKLAQERRTFDMVFVDADWENQWAYFEWAIKLTRANGCIVVDNAIRQLLNGNLGRDDSLVAKIGKDKRVSATLVPTALVYGPFPVYDGFIFAIVKDAE